MRALLLRICEKGAFQYTHTHKYKHDDYYQQWNESKCDEPAYYFPPYPAQRRLMRAMSSGVLFVGNQRSTSDSSTLLVRLEPRKKKKEEE